MNPRSWLLPLFVFLLGCIAPLRAQDWNGKTLVKPSLVADTSAVVAGRPFTVGVRLQLEDTWHVYWQNPGEAGGAPQITWELPEGFKAGEIQWPLPHSRVDDGDLLTYIYEHEVLLPVTITPPEKLPAGEITLKAKLRWLVCAETCIPGKGEAELKLPAGGEAAAANQELFTQWRAKLPKSTAPPFELKWERAAKELALRVSGLPAQAKVEFFPRPPEGVTLGHPKVETVGGAQRITLPIKEGQPAEDFIPGVLAVEKDGGVREGWALAGAPAAPAATAAANSAQPVAAPTEGGLGWKLLLAFIGGLIMNVMPCVLPVIALKIFGFVKQAGESPERIFKLGLAFAAGVFAFFLGLAAIVSQLRGAFNFGYQFQNPWLLTGLIALVFIFALNLLGVFEIALSGGTATKLSQLSSQEGYGGAFMHGLFTTLLGTSCTAPFLSTSLGFAVTQPAPIVFLLFGAIAAGMSSPYLLLTAKPAWLKFLPKPGMWMERVKQIMGFIMLAVVVWLLGVLGSRGSDAVTAVSWFLLFLGLASWIYGVFSRSIVTWVVIAAVVAVGYFGFLQGAFEKAAKNRAEIQHSPDGIPWLPFDEAKVAAAVAAGEPVFIDFTADWCVNCKVYERVVLDTDPIQKAFKDRKITAFKADWTNADPEVSKALKSFGRVGVPLYVFYRPGEAKPVVMDALTQSGLLGEIGQLKSNQQTASTR